MSVDKVLVRQFTSKKIASFSCELAGLRTSASAHHWLAEVFFFGGDTGVEEAKLQHAPITKKSINLFVMHFMTLEFLPF